MRLIMEVYFLSNRLKFGIGCLTKRHDLFGIKSQIFNAWHRVLFFLEFGKTGRYLVYNPDCGMKFITRTR